MTDQPRTGQPAHAAAVPTAGPRPAQPQQPAPEENAEEASMRQELLERWQAGTELFDGP